MKLKKIFRVRRGNKKQVSASQPLKNNEQNTKNDDETIKDVHVQEDDPVTDLPADAPVTDLPDERDDVVTSAVTAVAPDVSHDKAAPKELMESDVGKEMAEDDGVTLVRAAASDAGLGTSAAEKVAEIETTAQSNVAKIEEQAVSDISALYKAQGFSMELPTTATVGTATVGAAGLAAAAGLRSDSVAKVARVEERTASAIAKVDAEAEQNMAKIYAAEGVDVPGVKEPPTSCRSSVTSATQAAAAARMGSFDLTKVSAVEKEATEKVVAIDQKATKQISDIYAAEGATMQPHSCAAAGADSVGAASAAAAAGLSSKAVKKIARIEQKAADDVTAVDFSAEDEAKSAFQGGGIDMPEGSWKGLSKRRNAGSAAASTAVAAGLGATSVRKISSIENRARSKAVTIEAEALDQVHNIYEENDTDMGTSEGLFSSSQAANITAAEAACNAGLSADAVTKVAEIEERAYGAIVHEDDKAKGEVSAIYAREGLLLPKDGWNGISATRNAGVLGGGDASDVASRRSKSLLQSIGNAAHLGVYDFGAGVAAVGTAVTGADLAGPEEYDERYDEKTGKVRSSAEDESVLDVMKMKSSMVTKSTGTCGC